MDNLYREIILDHYKNPQNRGKIINPSSTFKMNNSACGDEIEMDIKVESKLIKDIKFRGYGCAISIASASLLTSYVLGKKTDKVLTMGKSDILELLKITPTPTRLKCALLPLEVLQKAIHLLQ